MKALVIFYDKYIGRPKLAEQEKNTKWDRNN